MEHPYLDGIQTANLQFLEVEDRLDSFSTNLPNFVDLTVSFADDAKSISKR